MYARDHSASTDCSGSPTVAHDGHQDGRMTQRILITGAAGKVGSDLRARLGRPDRVLRLLDVAQLAPAGPDENVELVQGSVTDLGALTAASAGCAAVVHLAAHSGERPWEQIRDLNIEGTYCAFEAARRAGVPRVVFASSNHAAGFHTRADGEAPDYAFPAPDTYYGVSKAAGEALGGLYHHRYGLDVVCLRIGSWTDRPADLRQLATWLSPNDGARLVDAALTAPAPGYRVVWGVSANTRRWWSLDEGRALGFRPRDDAEGYADELIGRFGEPNPNDPVLRRVGGGFTLPEYDAEHLS
jgi:uronate dehydrogenase